MHSFTRYFALVAVCSSLGVLGCSESSPPEPEPEPEATEAPTETVSDHMQEHFSQVKAAQEAVIRGDLEALKTATEWMAGHEPPEGLPDGWEPYVAKMQSAAQAAGAATDLAGASAAIATMARACGDCHQATDVKLVLASSPPPPEDTGTVPHMKGHLWAADRMWEGLIIPSDESWYQGTAALAVAALHGTALTGGEPREEVDALEAKVHALATQGAKAVDQDARAEVYGQFLATCAQCHQDLGKGGPN